MNTIPTYNNVHHRFRLNGFHLDRDDLLRVAYSFIKEGDDYEKHCGLFLLDWFDDKPEIEINTSGTTGTPKTILVSKQAMVNSALATGDFFDLQPGNKALHCLPTKYIAGKMMFVRGFILGLDMEFKAPSANPLRNDDTPYDFAALVPLQAENALEKLDNIKKIIIGGAKINPVLEKKLEQIPSKIYETYGMTETITHIAAKQVGESAFTVLPGVTISYDDQNCLVIHAPRISEEVIITNDLVELVNENQFVFLGRRDNVINSGGIKLIPEQIEAKLAGKIDARFFVSGIPDATLGEKLVLNIEGDEFAVADAVFSGLDKYERPKEIRFVPEFSETGSGKIIRKPQAV
ncbi:AMP-binding protein [Flavobacterium sp.]|uniref:AMP-binding protein n=1 Tax=Flavobacterium sp. TaxID=239 RepID=UPI00122000CE|nr:AMP-binding protein [Flavobacterium sp.]RZJ72854.1 MAG: O-succinylbenzoic acid--CoA ligase [Flavobacterium sp.]